MDITFWYMYITFWYFLIVVSKKHRILLQWFTWHRIYIIHYTIAPSPWLLTPPSLIWELVVLCELFAFAFWALQTWQLMMLCSTNWWQPPHFLLFGGLLGASSLSKAEVSHWVYFWLQFFLFSAPAGRTLGRMMVGSRVTCTSSVSSISRARFKPCCCEEACGRACPQGCL